MVNNVYRRSFSYPIHMIQNACNLRYKNAYTSCYICHAKCKKCTIESYTYATKELPHTKLTNHRLLEGRQKRAQHHRQKSKEAQTHKLPLNTCTRAKEHTKLTLHTWDKARSKTNQVAWPRPQTLRSQIDLPWSFLHNSLILVHHFWKW
jgi:hypothetical protein